MKINTGTIFFWVTLAHFALGAAISTGTGEESFVQSLPVQPLKAMIIQLKKPADKRVTGQETQVPSKKLEVAAESISRPSKFYKKPLIRKAAAQTTEPAQAPIPMALSDLIIEHQPEPVYPTASKRMGEEGKVIVRLLVGMKGLVEKIEIIKSSGISPLDQAALDAVRQWKFSPPKKSGAVHAAWVMVPILFTLG